MRTFNLLFICSLVLIFWFAEKTSAEPKTENLTLKGNSFLGYGSYVKVFGPMSPKALSYLASKNIQSIETKDDSNAALFNKHSNFCHLQKATLDSNHNSLQLIALAENFTDILSLTCKQEDSLLQSDLTSLAKFKTLQYLALQGYITSPLLFVQNIPVSINSLTLDKTSSANLVSPPTLNLPNLIRLVVNHETITKEFFKSIQTPKLEEIEFNHVNFLPDVLLKLELFGNLKKITLTYTTYDPQELKELEHLLPNLRIINNNIQPPSAPSPTDDKTSKDDIDPDSVQKFALAVRKKINKNWPGLICTWIESPTVIFRIWKDGHVSDLRVRLSGGYSFDEFIMKAVRKACPFNDFPDNANYLEMSYTATHNRELSEPQGIFRRF